MQFEVVVLELNLSQVDLVLKRHGALFVILQPRINLATELTRHKRLGFIFTLGNVSLGLILVCFRRDFILLSYVLRADKLLVQSGCIVLLDQIKVGIERAGEDVVVALNY